MSKQQIAQISRSAKSALTMLISLSVSIATSPFVSTATILTDTNSVFIISILIVVSFPQTKFEDISPGPLAIDGDILDEH